ncbi:hypothetical protein ACFLXJ_02880 [Chloroflexota bacterium]
MNDEELEQTLKGLSGKLDKLAKSDKPLTKEEKSRYRNVSRRKDLLSQIKEARKKGHKDAEVFHSLIYDMLISWGERRPFWMFIMVNLLRIKWGSMHRM